MDDDDGRLLLDFRVVINPCLDIQPVDHKGALLADDVTRVSDEILESDERVWTVVMMLMVGRS